MISDQRNMLKELNSLIICALALAPFISHFPNFFLSGGGGGGVYVLEGICHDRYIYSS